MSFFFSSSPFPFAVDGKAVVRTARKGHYDIENVHVFVSMQEVDAAIVRARKRRRPQTVYGEEESQARLGEVLKNKAATSTSSSTTSQNNSD